MYFHLPYHSRLERHLERIRPLWYNASFELPEVSGGRYEDTVRLSLLSLENVRKLAERFGPRFSLLANSTFPRLTDRVREAFNHLRYCGSSVVVAREEFAREVKEALPELNLRASCIMSFYKPFEEILESPLYESVCAPQFWNYDVELMSSKVPPEHRSRVYYILNSRCIWGEECRLHYEDMSQSYIRDPGGFLRKHGPPLDEPDVEKFAYRNLLVFEGLKEQGFTSFKLQGRTEKPLRTLYEMEILLGLSQSPERCRQEVRLNKNSLRLDENPL